MATLYKWCTVASGTFKYVVPRLTCQHEGAARVMTFQPRNNIFECSTSKRASSVLSYDQLWASTKSRWIIYLVIYVYVLPLKTLKFPMSNCVVWLLHHHHISIGESADSSRPTDIHATPCNTLPYLTLPYLRGEQSVKQAAQRWGHLMLAQCTSPM